MTVPTHLPSRSARSRREAPRYDAAITRVAIALLAVLLAWNLAVLGANFAPATFWSVRPDSAHAPGAYNPMEISRRRAADAPRAWPWFETRAPSGARSSP
jgi:hypothetical protein